jgi:hypothetical protein
MADRIGTLQIKNTKNLLTEDTRLCALIYCPPKFGKTKLAASLDDFTKKFRGKPTLIIASEVAEGGGTMTLNDLNIDYVMPSNWNEMESLIASLATNEYYGGIVLDNVTDYVNRIVKPHAMSFPSKERDSGTRLLGVPVRGDYQVMGESTRTQLNRLINLTNENTQGKFRKDLIVTALQKEVTDDAGNLTAIVPELPGALAGAVTAMFQSVLSINIKQTVVKQGDGSTKRISTRQLLSTIDPMRRTDDRMGIFKTQNGMSLTNDAGEALGLVEIYEKWLASRPATAVAQ